MPDESTVPEFKLPDWGTDGAPPEPAVPDDPPSAFDDPIEISVERPMVVTAGPLPNRWDVQTVHGLVVGHGKSERDSHLEAVESATLKAIAQLEAQGAERGANAVIDTAVTVSGRKSKVVVTAWGTAVTFSR